MFRTAVIFFLCCLCCVSTVFAADRGPIPPGETRVDLDIVGPGYLDTWTFDGTAGDRVLITAITTSGDLDTWLDLYPPGGGPKEADGWPWGDLLDHQLQQTGTYTIVMRDYYLSQAGTYNISFLKLPGTVSSPTDPDGGPIESGETLSGTVNVASDLDAFQFYGEAGDRVLITGITTSGTLDTWLDLYPPDGGPMEADGWPWGDVIDHQLAQTGVYTIVISDYDLFETGAYNITLIKMPGTVSSPADPDGGPIESGETLSGTINVASDLDAFQFYGEAGDHVVITGITTSGTLDTWLDLYPPDGGPMEADGWPWGDVIDHQLAQTGVYTIVIGDYDLFETGAYNITFLKMPGAVSSPGDPDGGPVASDETVSGTINVASDLDALQFYGEAGDHVVITAITTSGTLDTWLHLYPPDGGAKEEDGWPWGDVIDHQLAQTGVYTIVIGDYDLFETGAYNITFLKMPGAVTSSQDPDGGAIASAQARSGTINAASDLDPFHFYGQAGDRVIITAISTSGALDTWMDLYPPDGGPMEADGWPWGDEIDHQLLQTGLYTVVVTDYDLFETGTYDIYLTKIPATLRPGLYNPVPANGAAIQDFHASFAWDTVAGATGYDLYFGEDVIAPLDLIGSDLPTPSLPFPELLPSTNYYWRVIAHTAGGDIEGPVWWFRVPEFQTWFEDDDPAINYTGPWLQIPHPALTGGHGTCSKTIGASASFAFTGTGIAWHVIKGPMMGKAHIYLDAVPVATLDLYSPYLKPVTLAKPGLPSGPHTAAITVSSQKNPSSTNYFVDIDAFEVVP